MAELCADSVIRDSRTSELAVADASVRFFRRANGHKLAVKDEVVKYFESTGEEEWNVH